MGGSALADPVARRGRFLCLSTARHPLDSLQHCGVVACVVRPARHFANLRDHMDFGPGLCRGTHQLWHANDEQRADPASPLRY